jgi:hypothetical protein
MSRLDVFPNTTKYYIMANITDKYIAARLDERRRVLLKGKLPKSPILHITLLQLQINQSNPHSKIFYDKTFMKNIKKFYNKTIKKKNMILSSKFGQYDLLGQTKNKFFVKVYNTNKSKLITEFRILFYKYLERVLGKPVIMSRIVNGKKYIIFSYKNKELFAVPDFYYGYGEWTPHISILNIADIEKYNKPLYAKYSRLPNTGSRLNLLFTPIVNARFRPIGKIHMKDIGSLSISLRNKRKKIDLKYNIY